MLPVSPPQLNTSGGGLIGDETFDFDFPVSPPDSGVAPVVASGTNHTFTCDGEEDDADEVVFFGPVGHTEQCIAVAVEEEAQTTNLSWSPLSSEQHVELFKESQMLLYHLNQCRGPNTSSSNSVSGRSLSTPGKSRAPTILPVKSSSPLPDTDTQPLIPDSQVAQKPGLLTAGVTTGGKSKRKLSDTSFMCSSIYSESDVSSVNISQLSLIDKPASCDHSSPESTAGTTTLSAPIGSTNVTFTLNPPESLPQNLSAILPKGRLTPNADGVVMFGTTSGTKECADSRDSSAKNKKSSLLRPPLRRGIAVLSPPKRMKTCPTPENVRQQSHSVIQNTRNNLAKSGTTARRSLNNPPKKTGLKPPNMNNTFHLSKPSSASAPTKTTGLKPPALKSSLSLPNKPDPLGRSPGLNRTYNSLTQPAQSSALKAPSAGLKAPSASSLASVKKEMKAPAAKPQLIKANPVTLQRKTLAANRTKLTRAGDSTGLKVPGPVKAVVPAKPAAVSTKVAAAPIPVTKVTSKLDSLKPQGAVKETKGAIQSTPVKQQKKFQPKKIFPGQAPKPQPQRLPSTPGRESLTSSPCHSDKRRSFLPTPKRSSISSFRSSGSSVSSIDSVISNSPAFPMKGGRSKVQHTPVGGNKENEPKRSIWSPVPRPKAITKEQEHTQCTKHTALKLKN